MSGRVAPLLAVGFLSLCLVSITEGANLVFTPPVFKGSGDCPTKKPLCLDQTQFIRYRGGWLIGQSEEALIGRNPQGGWGSCFQSDREVNSAWFYIKIKKAGNIGFNIVADNKDVDLDFLLFGPFDGLPTTVSGCDADIQPRLSDTVVGTEVDCGYSFEKHQDRAQPVEHVFIPTDASSVGKFYTFLLNDQAGNSTFKLEPDTTNTGETDCEELRGATKYLTDTGAHSSILVGSVVDFTIVGFLLDRRANVGDKAKTVLHGASCEDNPAGVDRLAENFSPDEEMDVSYVVWPATFLLRGRYQLCYKPRDKPWGLLPGLLEVTDPRPRPPPRDRVYLPDAMETNVDKWVDVTPRVVITGERALFTFTGFERSYEEVEAKVVVEDCLESWSSVPGGEARMLDVHGRAYFDIVAIGKYRLCVRHRKEWETLTGFLTVTSAAHLEAYFGYQTCGAMVAEEPGDMCGCWYDQGSLPDSPPAVLPLDFPVPLIRASQKHMLVNQGCCMRNTPERVQVAETVTEKWGWCRDTSVQ